MPGLRPVSLPVHAAGSSRRAFLWQAAAATLAVHPLLGCGGSGGDGGNPGRAPRPGEPFMARDFALPQTQSPARLASFLEALHPEFHINGWYFMGSLGAAGSEFTLSVEHTTAASGAQPVRMIATYLDPTLPAWELGYADSGVLPLAIESAVAPWSYEVRAPVAAGAPVVALHATAGRFGDIGAEYLLAVALPQASGSLLTADIRLRDPFGVVAEGYGTAACSLGYLRPEQRHAIVEGFGGFVQAYVDGTGDPMIEQGNFYYQLPLMEVTRYTVRRDATVLAEGRGGLIWCDYVAASYDAAALAAYRSMQSNFFVIQLPELDTALMVLRIDSANGSAPTAMLFDGTSRRARNGARQFAYAWPITGISIDPDPASRWVSALTGHAYYLRYRVRLDSAERHADLRIAMALDNQEVPVESEPTYAGLTTVDGMLDGRAVRGAGFTEIWSGLKQ